MRIVIDMQGAQLAADDRTVDETSIAFVKALAEHSNHEIFLALSGLYLVTVEPIRAALDGILTQENIRLWYAPENNAQVAAIIREAFLLHLQPDIVHFANFNHPESLRLTADNLLGGKKPLTVQLINREGSEISEDEKLYLHDISEIFVDEDKRDWAGIAQQTITIWTELQDNLKSVVQLNNTNGSKPRLAYVSPLPPERTGIADYSAELLPALAEFYDIELIVDQQTVDDEWINNNLNVRDVAWFRENAHQLDRVVYHFGNSYFHAHMLELLREIPGVVVLHDFYLANLMEQVQKYQENNALIEALKDSHGVHGLRTYAESMEQAVLKYPSNLEIFRNACSVIFHSQYAMNLTRDWYGNAYDHKLHFVPLARKAVEQQSSKTIARKELGLDPSKLIVCSFGYMGEIKLNHVLLDAWSQCSEEFHKAAELFFIGDCPDTPYGVGLQEKISNLKKTNVSITGFVSAEEYRLYLEATDIAVQLRTKSRGETPASVLDCMNYSLPVIINANGSLAEFDGKTTLILKDKFEVSELRVTLEDLWKNPEKRYQLGAAAKQYISENHAPEACARGYAKSIEKSYVDTTQEHNVIHSLSEVMSNSTVGVVSTVAKCLSKTLQKNGDAKKLYIEISAIQENDLKTGIQRVVRAILLQILENPPEGYSIEPVYLSGIGGKWHFRSAESYLFNMVSEGNKWPARDVPVDFKNGDTILCLDFSGGQLVEADKHADLFRKFKNHGVSIFAVIYDILPIQLPQAFPIGTKEHHEKWANVIAKFDGAIAISKTVADDFSRWLEETDKNYQNRRPYMLNWFHLGADIESSVPTKGIPEEGHRILEKLSSEITFLMVGTIEPRKGHAQILNAFDSLWSRGVNLNLVIVGKQGWNVDSLASRLSSHHESSKRLFWLEGISDEYLERVYAVSNCLIAASYGEGFGLPLIEASQRGLPIFARDIPVFREVAKDAAFFFKSESDEELVDSVSEWVELYERDLHPKPSTMIGMSWKDSANQLLQRLNIVDI